MPPSCNKQRTSSASSWWERSIVKRSTHSIQNMVDTMMADAHFLQKHEHRTSGPANDPEDAQTQQLQRANVQIGHLLGKGSFSVVCEVLSFVEDREPEHDCTFGTTTSSMMSLLDRQDLQDVNGRFAIKHLRPDLVQKPELFQAAAADLLLEAKYLAALNHPGILKLRGVAQGGVSAYETSGGQYDGFFLITDRLQCTLREKILEWQVMQQEESLLEFMEDAPQYTNIQDDSRPLGDRLLLEKMDIGRQIASALQYIHERRLIFRDLKPANVGMTADNRVQLFDFGFCRELPLYGGDHLEVPEGAEDEDDDLYYMSGKGSMMYLAPEVLQNGRYNRKADCYSFAMVFYELLTLNKPFHSMPNLEAFREMLVKHQTRPPLEYSDVPLQLQDLLKHSWDNTVSDRWTMKQIRQRLEEISVELDPSVESEVEVVANQHQLSNAAGCDGGFLFQLVTDFARDVRLGYKILSGKKEFQSSPIEASMDESCGREGALCRDSFEEDISGVRTAATAESSILTLGSEDLSIAFNTLRVTAMTAIEEPVEVTLEEAMTELGWHTVVSDCEPLTPHYSQDDEVRQTRDEDELRCPPSPPLARTTSAPLQQKLDRITTNVPSSPHFPQRRQSVGSVKGFYLPEDFDMAPSLPTRRQSTGGEPFAFPTGSHFLLPSAA